MVGVLLKNLSLSSAVKAFVILDSDRRLAGVVLALLFLFKRKSVPDKCFVVRLVLVLVKRLCRRMGSKTGLSA